MSSGVEVSERDRVRVVVEPALNHLIRLESYLRLHELEAVSVHLEAALNELEQLMVRDDPTVGDTGDAPVAADQDQRLYTAG